MKVVKITNPLWLGVIADQVRKFAKKINFPTIDYETLYSYFLNTIQFGGNAAEFVVVFDNDESPVAFAHWMVRGLPHRGCVYCDFIHNWGPAKCVDLLISELERFALKNRAPIITGVCINEAVFRLFVKKARKHGYEIRPMTTIPFMARKVK